MLLYSIVSLSRFLLDFTRLLPLTQSVECIYTFSSQDICGSSCLNQLKLEKIEYRVGHSRKNSPIAGDKRTIQARTTDQQGALNQLLVLGDSSAFR